ncbi:MAG: hypothetical protein OSB67_01600 [Alphaproteobacteria bacterium]|nr:hypothetical protein [Alphaproteobacteria bacterium]
MSNIQSHSNSLASTDTPGGGKRLAFAIAVNVLLKIEQVIGGEFFNRDDAPLGCGRACELDCGHARR